MFYIPVDGVYQLTLGVTPVHPSSTSYNVSITITLKGDHGYLSAMDWPLLPVSIPTSCRFRLGYGLAPAASENTNLT